MHTELTQRPSQSSVVRSTSTFSSLVGWGSLAEVDEQLKLDKVLVHMSFVKNVSKKEAQWCLKSFEHILYGEYLNG